MSSKFKYCICVAFLAALFLYLAALERHVKGGGPCTAYAEGKIGAALPTAGQPPAPLASDRRLDAAKLEERVGNLEKRLLHLEESLQQLQGARNGPLQVADEGSLRIPGRNNGGEFQVYYVVPFARPPKLTLKSSGWAYSVTEQQADSFKIKNLSLDVDFIYWKAVGQPARSDP